uniref:Uncharacterized protein n=1 Tax=Cynoglossus semilaevis TaxID=244447 RepID=A0A3P8VQP2_CYNSE
MLQHQDQPLNYRGHGGANSKPSSSLRNRKCEKDGNFNFLPWKDDFTGNGGGDENQNPVRPRSLGLLGRDPHNVPPSSGHHNAQRQKMSCWSPLEPLPEIESGEDGYGRVPPDGAEERRMEEEEVGMLKRQNQMKQQEMKLQMKRGSFGFRGREEDQDRVLDREDENEWGDSGSDSGSEGGSSGSSLHTEGAAQGDWSRLGVGETRSNHHSGVNRETPSRHHSFSRKSLSGSYMENFMEEEMKTREDDDDSSDTDGELPEMMDAVWTLRDREHFKAQEMEKHQVQLTMYRRLALIRWVRTLQSRVQEQQNRLQSSFDVILTHRKELLRMGGNYFVAFKYNIKNNIIL